MRRGVFFSVALTLVLVVGTAGLVLASEVAKSDGPLVGSTMTSDIESVSLVTREWNTDTVPAELVSECGIQVFSNQTCYWWSRVWLNGADDDSSDSSGWRELSPEAFETLMDTIDSEGFWEMQDEYSDANSQYLDTPPTDTLTVNCTDMSKSVVFEHNSMLGLMPETWCAVCGSIYDSASVEVSVEMVSEFAYEVSAVARNEGDSPIFYSGVASDSWKFAVVRENGCTFLHEDSAILCTCAGTIEPGAEFVLEPQPLNASSFCDGEYVVFVRNPAGGGFALLTIEGNHAYVNTPPRDHGNVVSQDGSDSGVWTIQLLRCCDWEDRPEDILVQWDWESDGEWDTAWSSDKTATHDFGEAEELNVTYRLKDTDGAMSLGYIYWSTETGTSTVWGTVSLAATMAVVLVAAIVVVVFLVLRSRQGARR